MRSADGDLAGPVLEAAVRRLATSSDSARLDAELLLAHVLGCARGELAARDRQPVPVAMRASFDELVRRRSSGTPIAYLTGRRGFWTLELHVNADVLVPRPETELLVEWALEDPAARVADLGTGSGAIALALASEWPAAELVATDASPAALNVARANARRLGLNNVSFHAGNWYDALPPGEAFDLLVSNPPYVAAGDPHLEHLPDEPAVALVSGPDGLDALRTIIAQAPGRLAKDGRLLVEHGAEQGAAVCALFKEAGFDRVRTRRDLAGLERASGGVSP